MDDSPQQEQTTEEESTHKETINIHFPQSQTASSTETANDELTQPEIEPAVTTHRYVPTESTCTTRQTVV